MLSVDDGIQTKIIKENINRINKIRTINNSIVSMLINCPPV